MRTLFINLAVAFIALPVSAQPRDDQNWARCVDSDPDVRIAGCTALIQSGPETSGDTVNAYINRGVGSRPRTSTTRPSPTIARR